MLSSCASILEPIFSTLLDEENGGRFRIAPATGEPGLQRWRLNTNVLETTFVALGGSVPRYRFRAAFHGVRAQLPADSADPHRSSPIAGTPRISVVCEPRLGWSKERPQVTHGSHHLRFEGFPAQRLASLPTCRFLI